MPCPQELIDLARALAASGEDLAMLAEGNVSLRTGETLWVKASGFSMESIDATGFAEVSVEKVMRAFGQSLDDRACRETLNAARVRAEDPPPSTETFMHAALLELPGVSVVAHTHPVALLALLSTEDAAEFADRRLFPDEIVCCGRAACHVPYEMPGLPLADKIMQRVASYRERWGLIPKTIWLQNHGLIALGATPSEALAATRMQEKAARVLLGALQTGRPISWLTAAQADAIFTWPDEHARQKRLFGG